MVIATNSELDIVDKEPTGTDPGRLWNMLRSFLRPGGPLVDCLILAKAG